MEALDQKINSSQELKDKVKNTKIAVYSSKEYVKEFMEKPVRGTFPDTKFCDVSNLVLLTCMHCLQHMHAAVQGTDAGNA